MRALFQQWIVTAVINFILRQIAKFTDETDWKKVLADAQDRVADLVPGTWFDDEAQRIVAVIIMATERALRNKDSLEKIITLLAEEKYVDAGQALKDYMLKAWAAKDFLEEMQKSDSRILVSAKTKGYVELYRPMA